ncbi:glycosyltransferase family 4 protein [Ruminococcus flavefaciens]|uniref:glycosyltransferase family 4 protein n=1 Tax=Ruminococcus flavefaciens TaxID=1265 RepID=UPI0003191E1F|nr:glycosyltransferase [Ruminococcus flavefaciens]
MKKKIAILGHFGGDQDFLDGQTVKTKILYNELKEKTDWDIQKIDTYWKRKNPIKLLFCTLSALIAKKDVIVLLSINGMKLFFPILSFFAKIWNVRIYHDVIGGSLDKYVEQYPKFKKYLNSFTVNWVETEILKNGLKNNGVLNCKVIPNFKKLNILSEEELPDRFDPPFRFCTFSRVMKEKGIETAIKAIEEINREKGYEFCTLDIYGAVDNAYKKRFNAITAKTGKAISYCGLVPYDKSVDVLKDYYALLFPTYWKGEGFPGTIVDAFSAGLPVVASDWNSNKEIISHCINGLLYPNVKIASLKDGIKNLIDNTDMVMKMKLNCIRDAKKYQPDSYVNYIVSVLAR